MCGCMFGMKQGVGGEGGGGVIIMSNMDVK